MHFMRLAAVLLVAFCCAAAAAPKEPQPTEIWLKASTTIDEQGHIVALDWETLPPLYALIAERLTPKIKAWEFVPATVDGEPAQTRTALIIRLLAEAKADNSLSLRFASAQTGPMAIGMQPPKYPVGAIKNDVSALVTTQLEVTVEGKAVIRDVQYTGSEPGDRYRASFLQAAKDAIAGWTFRPETVAGIAVATPVSIPIEFCSTTRRWCQQRHTVAEQSKTPVNVYIATESAVKLKTDIRAQAI